MSRLDSLSGASFRPAQSQNASGTSEKVTSKVLDGGQQTRGNRFDRDSFDRNPGFYACTARLPNPGEPRKDPGFYACTARLPQPKEPPVFGCAAPLPKPQDPGNYACKAPLPSPGQDPGNYACKAPLPSPGQDPGNYACKAPVPNDILDRLLKDLGL